jgi:hypothetical protein
LNSLFPPGPHPITALKARCEAVIERDDLAFASAKKGMVVTEATLLWMPRHPLTMRVALCLNPHVDDATPTQDFLRAFASGNPNYTGWPMWLDSRAFHDKKARPLVKDGAWQALIVDLESEFPHSDFMLLDPRGDFFLRRIMQDDLRRSMVEPGKLLDVTLMLCNYSPGLDPTDRL